MHFFSEVGHGIKWILDMVGLITILIFGPYMLVWLFRSLLVEIKDETKEFVRDAMPVPGGSLSWSQAIAATLRFEGASVWPAGFVSLLVIPIIWPYLPPEATGMPHLFRFGAATAVGAVCLGISHTVLKFYISTGDAFICNFMLPLFWKKTPVARDLAERTDSLAGILAIKLYFLRIMILYAAFEIAGAVVPPANVTSSLLVAGLWFVVETLVCATIIRGHYAKFGNLADVSLLKA